MTLFVLNSYPLQYIQANEVKSLYNMQDSECILIAKNNVNESRRDRICSTVEISYFSNFAQINLVNYDNSSRFRFTCNQYHYLKAITKQIITHNITRIVLGNYGNQVMNSIAHTFCNSKEVIFLDEGIATVNYIKSRKNKIKLFVSGIGGNIRKWMLSIKECTPNDRITFFTSYNLESFGNTKIIKHTFESFKRRDSENSISDEIVILGNPFVEKGYLTATEYCIQLGWIKSYFNSTNVIYIPHPNENYENLSIYEHRLKFHIKNIESSVEISLIDAVKPRIIVSFFSTALLTCFQLYGSKIKFYSFKPSGNIWLRNKKLINDIYQLYENMSDSNFCVINSNNKVR